MRRLAQLQRLADELSWRRRAQRRGDAAQFAGDAPKALHEAPGTLRALVGPDHVAVGRRIRQHEQPRRVGAIARDDVVGVDRVLLRLRHFFDRADNDFEIVLDQKGAAAVVAGLDADVGGRDPAVWAFIGLVHHHALGEEAGERLGQRAVA